MLVLSSHIKEFFTHPSDELVNRLVDEQAMIDVAADSGWLATTLRLQQLMQMVVQAVWIDDLPVSTLPHIGPPQVG